MGRGSDRKLDFGLLGLDPGRDAQCVLGIGGLLDERPDLGCRAGECAEKGQRGARAPGIQHRGGPRLLILPPSLAPTQHPPHSLHSSYCRPSCCSLTRFWFFLSGTFHLPSEGVGTGRAWNVDKVAEPTSVYRLFFFKGKEPDGIII